MMSDDSTSSDENSERLRKRREAAKAYRAANREALKEKARQYYAENAEKAREWRRQYYEANRDKHREYAKTYREANREKLAERSRASYDREKRRAYHAANREKVREQTRTRKYGITPARQQELLRQYKSCAICNSDGGARGLFVDHDHDTGEVRGLLCRSCNLGVGFFNDSPATLRKAAVYLEKHAPKLFAEQAGLVHRKTG